MGRKTGLSLMLITAGKRSLAAFAATVGVLMACGLALGYLEGKSTAFLYGFLGWSGIVLTGMVGTPVHELGHYLMCRLFGFQVHEVALFRPLAGRTDGVLGYVRYSYDPSSLWQRLGSFFVSIAPLALGGAAILLVLRLLTPEAFRGAAEGLSRSVRQKRGPLAVLGSVLSGFFGALFQLRGWSILRGVMALYLAFSISTHMTLSPADLQGASPGLVVVAGLCLLFGTITTALGADPVPALKKTAAVLAAFLSIGLFFNLLSLLLFGGLFFLFK